MITINEINLFKSIFRGREDAFATRWEKNGKSGYMPSYSFDPHLYKLHRMKGLFPNQDYLSGKGLGNLIALPLHKPALEIGNSCFVNPETLEPYKDQWEFLRNIQKVFIEKLDSLFQKFAQQTFLQKEHSIVPGKTNIRLGNAVYINRSGLTTPLINFLKEELNFANSEYFVKNKIGKNTWGTERYFKLIEETEHEIIIPRGFIGKLIRFCRDGKIVFDDILGNKNVKHHRQLVYLSQKHESQVLKLRFVLSPFSFVFLLRGNKQYHIVWETLDTEEATYIWLVEKNITALKNKLKQIDVELGTIREKGRQYYMEAQAGNFNRIVHDYSDERKGFVIWKDLLEERLV